MHMNIKDLCDLAYTTEYQEACSFDVPDLPEIPEKFLEKTFSYNEFLEIYREEQHTLSEQLGILKFLTLQITLAESLPLVDQMHRLPTLLMQEHLVQKDIKQTDVILQALDRAYQEIDDDDFY